MAKIDGQYLSQVISRDRIYGTNRSLRTDEDNITWTNKLIFGL